MPSNDDGNAKDDAWKKWNYIFLITIEFGKYLDQFTTPSGLKLYAN